MDTVSSYDGRWGEHAADDYRYQLVSGIFAYQRRQRPFHHRIPIREPRGGYSMTVFLEHGIDAIMGMAVQPTEEACKIAEDRTGKTHDPHLDARL